MAKAVVAGAFFGGGALSGTGPGGVVRKPRRVPRFPLRCKDPPVTSSVAMRRFPKLATEEPIEVGLVREAAGEGDAHDADV